MHASFAPEVQREIEVLETGRLRTGGVPAGPPEPRAAGRRFPPLHERLLAGLILIEELMKDPGAAHFMFALLYDIEHDDEPLGLIEDFDLNGVEAALEPGRRKSRSWKPSGAMSRRQKR
jgi:hypothetical protein